MIFRGEVAAYNAQYETVILFSQKNHSPRVIAEPEWYQNNILSIIISYQFSTKSQIGEKCTMIFLPRGPANMKF